MNKYLLNTLIIALLPLCILCQGREEGFVRTDTLGKTKNIKFIGLPIAFYTPETQFGVGGGGQMFLLNNTNRYNQRLSNILFSGIYTTAGQIMFNVTPQVYLGKGDYFIDADYLFEIYPNSFWGIGPDTPEDNEEQYDQTTHKVQISFLKRLPPHLNFGLTFNFANHQITEVEEGGILASGTVLGSDRTVISGLGAVFNKDSRNDASAPTDGQYLRLSAQFSSEIFGATHGFNKFVLDLREYIPLGGKSILATQIFLENNFGDVPFQGMAFFGGSSSARGYFYGRFLDKSMYVLQTEYRHRFKPRWTFAAFGLIGSVAGDTEELLEFRSIKPAFGAGVRYKLLKDQGTWLRLDFGSGRDGQSGIYFGVNEAF
ncbi:BamA/TamA family outer membrane protein [Poritiphilus flavus]|uniref:BamA/TamA family outer membrane protein n=1 Tax=Poritiphilus flavus TaxID=2697053 RepID=A0A6L9ECQ8_9FLAO|nr:BamA/TamA family outer membrane protein [Poritiphilus flavus]NAS12535.1 BamA/TamA family outer membrane protein [Poritiphilus flavus]